MKITIVGAGNAGCWTALFFSHYAKDIAEIEVIHDPSIEPVPVGQATVKGPVKLLSKTLGLNWYENKMKLTPKLGVLYENWGKLNKEYFHPIGGLDDIAMHYEPRELQNQILNSRLFTCKEEYVDEVNNIDTDYVIDCRGAPLDFSDYSQLTNPVNSCLVGRREGPESTANWSKHVATPDGWTFVIPNADQTSTFGYLYNEHVSEDAAAEANFKSLFSIETSIVRKLKFRNYLSNNPIIDERIILSGNKLFFLEPLESTAISTYLEWARFIHMWIIQKQASASECTKMIKRHIRQQEAFVLWHYMFGSTYESKFWSLCDSNFTDTCSSMINLLEDIAKGRSRKPLSMIFDQDYEGWGLFPVSSIHKWWEAMNQKSN